MRNGTPLLLVLGLLAMACSENTATSTTTVPVAATAASVAVGPTPVIVDYSPTVSDIGGFLYLLAHPDIEVIAVSLPVTGEAECDPGVQLTLGILSLVGQDHVPVACDPERPPAAEAWPAEFLEGQIKLLSGLPHPLPGEGGPTGTELIISTVNDSDRPVTIWAVGPLTNVARALDREPEIAGNIEEIVIMGGAVDVPGNVFGSPAEWNVFIDAGAAAE
ncbi:MAG: nucleoside hydrolase, partial [Actinomycetota bacterium]|nr:nucleoside hydrolase [Actinomycetota bacterium]